MTRVLSCVDTTIFEGSLEEMEVLNQTVLFYLQAAQEKDRVIDGVLADLARIPNGKGGVPLIINMAAPMLIGRNRLSPATMMAFGITDETDIAAGMALGMDDLLACYQLVQECPGTTLAEMAAATAVSKRRLAAMMMPEKLGLKSELLEAACSSTKNPQGETKLRISEYYF